MLTLLVIAPLVMIHPSTPILWLYMMALSSIVYMVHVTTSVNISIEHTNLISDEVSYTLTWMTLVVVYISVIATHSNMMNMPVTLLGIISILMFNTSNLILMYLTFEMSLLPILFIILKFGSYPDRSLASLTMLTFTAIFAVPFVAYISHSYISVPTFHIDHIPMAAPFLSLILLGTFCVKLPVYGLHSWLPLAHVEAPTSGSMLLAGILLKLGGVGLLRLASTINPVTLWNLTAYSITFLAIVTIICCAQSDFKRLVAYSSVSHMMTIPTLVIATKYLSLKSILLVMFYHGLSSPILFHIVGIVYSIYQTRNLISIRGLMLLNPLMALIMTLAMLFTLNTPPFPSFLVEVYTFLSSMYLTTLSLVPLFVFAFLSMVYTLSWYIPIVMFNTSNSSVTTVLNYKSSIPISITFLMVPFTYPLLCM